MDRASGDGGLAADTQRTGGPLVSRSRELNAGSVEAFFDATDRPRVHWATPDGTTVAGRGVAARFAARGPGRTDRIRSAAERRLGAVEFDGPIPARPRAFGGFAFHADRTAPDDDPWHGFEAAAFTVPAVQVTRTDERTWLTATDIDEATATATLNRWDGVLADVDGSSDPPTPSARDSPPAVESTTRSTDRQTWTAQVDDALDRIDRGELEKVVLAQALTTEVSRPVDVTATLSRLAERYPGCYRFAFDRAEAGTFFGATPERLVAKRGTDLRTEALAGSAPRGETPAEDEAYVTEMVESGKAQREHGFVVDSIREHLGPHATDVRVGEQTVRRLATIQHLRTPIEADLEPDRHVLDVVGALHPTPAVGGAPQRAASEAIRSIETFDRGWYAGPIGWFDADGDGEFAVGIRSAVARESTVTCFGGNGIVADSDPDEEWEEVQLKLQAIRDDLR